MAKKRSRGTDRVLWTEEKVNVRKAAGVWRARLLWYAVPALFLILSGLFYVWSRIQVIQLGYDISHALKEGRSLAETNKKLRIEVATLKSYARIERMAVEELNMSKPKPDQVIVIR